MKACLRNLKRLWRPLQGRSIANSADPSQFATMSYSQEGEDRVILRLIGDRKRSGFFVDVGAHHPCRFSNTYLLYLQGWRGVNIDANPDVLLEYSRVRPGDLVICSGVHDVPGELTYFCFDEPALNTFVEEAAIGSQQAGYTIKRKLPVRVQPLKALLDNVVTRGKEIDFLNVDTEGLDLHVLRSNDWERYRARLVAVEDQVPLSRLSESPIHSFMVTKGYEPVAKCFLTTIYATTS